MVPYMANTLNGWTSETPVEVLTQTLVNHKTDYITDPNITTLDLNKQPTPQTKVDRKPLEQRAWKWWSVIVKEGPLLKVDDVIIIDNIRYKIQGISNWSESGFQKYECTEDYQ